MYLESALHIAGLRGQSLRKPAVPRLSVPPTFSKFRYLFGRGTVWAGAIALGMCNSSSTDSIILRLHSIKRSQSDECLWQPRQSGTQTISCGDSEHQGGAVKPERSPLTCGSCCFGCPVSTDATSHNDQPPIKLVY